jgi:hypothetical protein
MVAVAMSDRIGRLEEKLDTIIRLTEAQDEKIKTLTERVETMAPTVKAGEEVFSTARHISAFAKWSLWVATGFIAFMVYMADRWHVVGQLFRKAG